MSGTMHRASARGLGLAIAIIVAACAHGPDSPASALATITVDLTPGSIQVGQTATAVATGRDQNGGSMPTGPVSWTEQSAAVATVNESGVLVAAGAGTTRIVATAGSVRGEARLTVTGGDGTPVPFSQIRTAFSHTCALSKSGAAYCWGLNDTGQVGDGTTGNIRKIPTLVSGGMSFVAIAPGYKHTCALTAGGAAWCWGANEVGQLGGGDSSGSRLAPSLVVGGHVFVDISANNSDTCARTAPGVTWCWGGNWMWALGDGTPFAKLSPTAVVGGLRFVRMATGISHSCAIAGGGAAYCWGVGQSGVLGDSTEGAVRPGPYPVSGGLQFSRIGVGHYHTCGLLTGGAANCWGSNARGAVGDGSTTTRNVPTATSGGMSFVEIEVSEAHTCALTAGGAAWCWGYNSPGGELGDGTTATRLVPTAVAGGHLFTQLTTGFQHTCGLIAGGAAWCWGWNLYGELGIGTSGDARPVPVPVHSP